MEFKIIDGKTIISTGIGRDAVKNKTGVKGLTYHKKTDNYSLSCVHQGKKYHLGYYATIEEGKAMRKKVDNHVENGTFLQWIEDIKSDKVINQFGVKGLYKKPNASSYQLNISYLNKKYFLGMFKAIDTAKAIREEADKHIEDGTFIEWIEEYKNK